MQDGMAVQGERRYNQAGYDALDMERAQQLAARLRAECDVLR